MLNNVVREIKERKLEFDFHFRFFNPVKKRPAGEIIPTFNFLPRVGIAVDRTFNSVILKLGWLNVSFELRIEFVIIYEFKPMETDTEPKLPLPQKAIYYRKVMKWNANGVKFFDTFAEEVLVVGKTDKSYQIKFSSGGGTFNGRETYVRKNRICFSFLTNGDYCLRKQRRVPTSACKICYEKCCYLKGKDFPHSY